MNPSRPSTPTSASPTRLSKRPLSSPAPPSTPLKRANSEDQMPNDESDHEGSIGASRLNIASTPSDAGQDNDPDLTLTAPDVPADSPPAYEQLQDADGDELPDFQGTASGYNGPAPDSQLAVINDLKRSPLEEGDAWYLVSRAWYRRWQVACSGVQDSKEEDTGLLPEEVGPLDNAAVLGQDGQLRRMPPVQDGVDVELVPAQAWGMLKEWYGLANPSHELERTVLAIAGLGSESIEFYPPTFQFFLLVPSSSASSTPLPTLDRAPQTALSSAAAFSDLLTFASTSFELTRPTRLWRLPPVGDAVSAQEGPAWVFDDKLRESGVELLTPPSSNASLADALLTDPETRLAVEQQDKLGNWIVDEEALRAALALADVPQGNAAALPALEGGEVAKEGKKKGLFAGGWSTALHISSSGAKKEKKEEGKKEGGFVNSLTGALTRSKAQALGLGGGQKGQRGLTGLSNLGNTCFMNSAIQCMSNTKELQEYFLSGVYHNELNKDNPLGMGGAVAIAFGALLERLWASSGSSVAPREFKQALSKFAPQFSGYGQQDSQELLAFLLDGTHEDLNRIKKKPATEAPDWAGGGDKELVELARTCWEQYRSRNDSVIVDLFQGQYRSTVVCPDCEKVSITFDPFMYVTTNLPVTKKWSGTVYVVPVDPKRPVLSVELEVPKTGSIKTLKALVGGFVQIDPKKLIVTEEFSHKFWREWHDDEPITDVQNNDKLIFYESTVHYPQPRPRNQFFKKLPPIEPAADGAVHLVVGHRHHAAPPSAGSSRPIFGTRRDDGDLFGSPFIVTLTKEEACDEKAALRKIATQYARVTKKGDELLETIEAWIAEMDEDAPVELAPPQMDNQEPARVVAGSSTSSSEQALSTAPSSVFADSAAPSSAPSPPATAAMDVDLSAPAAPAVREPFASGPSADVAAEAASAPSAPPSSPQPRRSAPFRLEIVRRPDSNGRLPLKVDFGELTQTIEERKASLRKSAGFERKQALEKAKPEEEDVDMISPGASGAVDEVKDGEKADVPPTAAASPASPVDSPPLPIFKTGQWLISTWDRSACDYFFNSEDNKWNACESIVDPAILAKREKKGAKKTITLQDCLTEFTKEERLGEDDMWYCSSCKEHKQATKKVELWKVPDVVVIALKRFSSGRYSRDKLDDFVDFPLEGLDLEPFVEGDRVEKRLRQKAAEGGETPIVDEPDTLVYDCYAVSNHFGGLGGGHYTAFAKNPENAKWYDFDDSRVTEISADRVPSSAAYLLFYRRRTARPIGGTKSRELVESAVASRAASAVGSAPASAQISPLASRDSLSASISSLDRRQHAPHSDEDEDLFNGTDDEARLPGAFSGIGSTSSSVGGGSGGFTGMFSAPSTNQLASPPDSNQPNPPSPRADLDDIDEWLSSGPMNHRDTFAPEAPWSEEVPFRSSEALEEGPVSEIRVDGQEAEAKGLESIE